MRIVIQGIKGSFHDLAARRYFGPMGSRLSGLGSGSESGTPLELLECSTFRQVVEAVESGAAEYGMMAIENTIAGSIPGNYKLLENHSLSVVGEVYLRIRHCLVALPGQSLKDIDRVLGHPVAIPQCDRFLQAHPWMRVEEAADTASSARLISAMKLERTAAIAGYAAAEMYGLSIYAERIEDDEHNMTRFLALSRDANALAQDLNKATVSMRVADRAGSLAEALGAIKYAHINLTKIESIPLVDVPFEYAIHLDLGFEDVRDFSNALRELERLALDVRVLGIYRQGERDLESTSKKARAGAEAKAEAQVQARSISRCAQGTIGTDWRSWGLGPSAQRPEHLLIAGPCSAESEEQLVESAIALKASGWPVALRAGIWKPRTRAGGFEGHGEPALQWLREAKRETGLPTAVEVASASHVEACLKNGVDILWLGARTTGNPFSVQEIADVLSGTDAIVMVKNPISPDLDLWIGAIERLARVGLTRLGAIHRGFSSSDTGGLRNAPEWSIPLQFRKRMPGVPLICDPSHITGRRDALTAISQRALDLGMDGLMVEVHRDPSLAWTDASQQLAPSAYAEMMSSLVWRPTEVFEEQLSSKAWSQLDALRSAIDRLDHELLELLACRLDVVRQIGEYKRANKMDVLQPDRWSALMDRRLSHGERLSLGPSFVGRMFALIHEESLRVQSDTRIELESA
jgi:chorismate mutase